eukprot:3159995-Rhodomonas_salina.5
MKAEQIRAGDILGSCLMIHGWLSSLPPLRPLGPPRPMERVSMREIVLRDWGQHGRPGKKSSSNYTNSQLMMIIIINMIITDEVKQHPTSAHNGHVQAAHTLESALCRGQKLLESDRR